MIKLNIFATYFLVEGVFLSTDVKVVILGSVLSFIASVMYIIARSTSGLFGTSGDAGGGVFSGDTMQAIEINTK